MFSFPAERHRFQPVPIVSRLRRIESSGVELIRWRRVISGWYRARSNLIGKKISLSPSNRADCSPELGFILNEGREGSMDVYVQEFNLFFRRNYRAKLFFVASRPYVFRLSLEIPRANLAFFISPSLYLRPWRNETPTFNSGWKLWQTWKSHGFL